MIKESQKIKSLQLMKFKVVQSCTNQLPYLQTWITFIPRMDKLSHAQ